MSAMTFHTQIRQQLLGNVAQPQADEAAQLNNALRLLAKWRSVLLQNTLLQGVWGAVERKRQLVI